jgi:hypothetical protein
MKTLNKLQFLVLSTLIIATVCGGDDGGGKDGGGDDGGNNFPPAPALGAQIDRIGRPAINTALNAVFEPDAAKKAAQKDAYNQAGVADAWATVEVATGQTVVKEFSKHIAVFDMIDTGDAAVTPNGCGNGALYTAPPSATSYDMLSTVLADDQLYVDTTKGTCEFYLSVEVEVATGGALRHTECGGRTLTQDVVDSSYSVLAAGLHGFNPANFAPLLTDGAGPHADVSNDTFPFLGAPH